MCCVDRMTDSFLSRYDCPVLDAWVSDSLVRCFFVLTWYNVGFVGIFSGDIVRFV